MARTYHADAFDTYDLTTSAVNLDPWGYYGRLRETDPVHWNELFKTWLVTRHDDSVYLTGHHERFSSKIPRPYRDVAKEYPPIDAADWPLAERHATWRAFIFNDRPAHHDQRQRLHQWSTPRSVER